MLSSISLTLFLLLIPLSADANTDTDGDGVPDSLDDCPATPAGYAVDVNGCQDSDRDGVADFEDLCPATSLGYPVNADGCITDTDGDGVPDSLDDCPATPAGFPVDNDGCMYDFDGDGVPSHLDMCSATPAGTTVAANGCPDTDGDGVSDTEDDCPATPAGTTVAANGCHDTDDDGIEDTLDSCPMTPAGVTVDYDGCPTDGPDIRVTTQNSGPISMLPGRISTFDVRIYNSGDAANNLVFEITPPFRDIDINFEPGYSVTGYLLAEDYCTEIQNTMICTIDVFDTSASFLFGVKDNSFTPSSNWYSITTTYDDDLIPSDNVVIGSINIQPPPLFDVATSLSTSLGETSDEDILYLRISESFSNTQSSYYPPGMYQLQIIHPVSVDLTLDPMFSIHDICTSQSLPDRYTVTCEPGFVGSAWNKRTMFNVEGFENHSHLEIISEIILPQPLESSDTNPSNNRVAHLQPTSYLHATNLRIVDAFGNSLDTISIDQETQISIDLSNVQNRDQEFAYLVQIQDANNVVNSLAWITGSLSTGQSFSPALSWIPTEAGTYTVTAFVWESVNNPNALSPPLTILITVN